MIDKYFSIGTNFKADRIHAPGSSGTAYGLGWQKSGCHNFGWIVGIITYNGLSNRQFQHQ